ncbi:MAG: SDR family NAD(P)-dependent oxidoreductase [Sphingobacteriales bacterium]|nr:MAG: SDR family NAD(P)-dependent oxidoreductase [Sphingobacteriales bacterium]
MENKISAKETLRSSAKFNRPATAVVTGASSGFGAAIAQALARDFGYDLILTGRREDRLETLAAELQETYGIQVHCKAFDIRDRSAVEAAFSGIDRQLRHPLRILVNNAGLAAGLSTIDEGNIDDWDVMIDTNLKGLLYVTRTLLPSIKGSGNGHIVNIGSTAGKNMYRNGNVYAATKSAVDALNQAMRIDLLPYGIKVTAVHPGAAETEFSLVRFKGDAERAKAVYEGFTPLAAEDVAQTVAYCLSLPDHVCINDLVITCTTQANSFYNVKAADLKQS